MKIAIEASLASASCPTGLGIYVDKLLQEFAKGDYTASGTTFYLLHHQKVWHGKDYGKNFHPVSYHFSPSQFLAISFRLNKVLEDLKADLFHATGTTGVPHSIKIPAVTTVHDLFPLTLPGSSLKKRILTKILFSWVLKGSKEIISNSEFTRSELFRFGVKGFEPKVIYLDSSLDFPERAASTELPLLGEPLEKGFFLCVGAMEERKGQLRLCREYLNALKEDPTLPQLVFAGPDRGDCSRLRSLAQEEPKIRILDYIQPSHLHILYQNAGFFCFPSLAEGFGIPVVEAMKAGIPVLASDIPVLREIAGGAASFVPLEEGAFAKALLECRKNEGKNLPDREKVMEYALRFSWKENAEKTWAIYKNLLNNGKKNP